jgi:hypothetical protein
MTRNADDISWSSFTDSVEKLEKNVAKYRAANINAADLRSEAKEVAQIFFRQCAVELLRLQIEDELFDRLNQHCQHLLKLSTRQNSKKSYLKTIRQLRYVIDQITVDREFKYWDIAAVSSKPEVLTDQEALIFDTLNRLVSSAAISYRQALIDLANPDRISYRGVANELRETLRETLDYLASDEDVISQPGFQFDKDKKTPTMKQKVRYILRARETADNAMKAPEEAIGIVEERVASFTRATYERSSISAHVASERKEVSQIKNYVNVVLSELLALQS